LDWETITSLEKTGQLPKEQPLETLGQNNLRILTISDIHGLHYCPIAWQVVLDSIPHIKPDRIIINGDLLDFYEISRYAKNPNVEQSVAEEIAHVKTLLAQLRAVFPHGIIDFVPGNHEKRYELYIRSDAKKLEGLKVLELPNLLDLEGFRVTLHQEDGFLLRPDFYVYHGSLIRKHAALTGQGELEKNGISGTSGHTHRLGTYRKTGIRGRETWSESGCLCNMNPEFVIGAANWQQGFVIVDFHSEAPGDWSCHDVEIVNGKCVLPLA